MRDVSTISTPAAIKSGAPVLGISSLCLPPRTGRCVALGTSGRRVAFFIAQRSESRSTPPGQVPRSRISAAIRRASLARSSSFVRHILGLFFMLASCARARQVSIRLTINQGDRYGNT